MTQPDRAFIDIASGNRIYYNHDVGNRFDGVTSIMGTALPKQQYLVPWAAKLVAQAAWDFFSPQLIEEHGYIEGEEEEVVAKLKDVWRTQRDDAGDLGTTVHEICDEMTQVSKGNGDIARAWLDEQELEQEVYRRVDGYAHFLTDFDVKPVATEFTIYNETHGYAGSCDLAAFVNGEPYFLDWKTNKTLGSEIAMQITAYKHGEYLMKDKPDEKHYPMPFPDYELDDIKGGILHLQKTQCRFVPVKCDDEMFDAFLSMLLVKRLWVDGVAKEALQDVVYNSKKAHKS